MPPVAFGSLPGPTVLFVDHETRLSGGELDLVDLVRGLHETHGDASLDLHVALPGGGALADALTTLGVRIHEVTMAPDLRTLSRWELARRPTVAAQVGRSALHSVRDLDRVVRAVRPDVVHTNSMKAHLLAGPVARRRRVPLVWHVRDILQPGWLRTTFNGTAGVFPHRVICISHAVAAAFSGRGARRVRVVHNGVRPRPVSADEAEAARQQLGGGGVLVGIVGQLAHWKGQDVVLDAVRRLDDADVRLAIVGACLFPENEAAYERALHDHGMGDRVTIPGPISPVEPVMAALDVLVHASRLPEPFGRVIVEAMAQGTPVITTTIGAGRELVPDEAGALVPPDDPIALAHAIQRLTSDREALAAMGERAREAAREFDIARTARGVLDVYHEIGVGDR